MAGDLEDFLRRAAERRKAKEGGGGGQPQRPPQQPAARPAQGPPDRPQQRPQQQRQRPPEPEPVLVAEVVEIPDPFQVRREQIAEAKAAAEKAKAAAAKQASQLPATASGKAKPAPIESTGNVAKDLIQMLRRPGGISQAILLREILERPEHRW